MIFFLVGGGTGNSWLNFGGNQWKTTLLYSYNIMLSLMLVYITYPYFTICDNYWSIYSSIFLPYSCHISSLFVKLVRHHGSWTTKLQLVDGDYGKVSCVCCLNKYNIFLCVEQISLCMGQNLCKVEILNGVNSGRWHLSVTFY